MNDSMQISSTLAIAISSMLGTHLKTGRVRQIGSRLGAFQNVSSLLLSNANQKDLSGRPFDILAESIDDKKVFHIIETKYGHRRFDELAKSVVTTILQNLTETTRGFPGSALGSDRS